MSKLKFTPGPWILHEAEYPEAGGYIPPRVFSYADPDKPKIICGVATRDGETELANGKMIAAAPEMYEALKEIYYELDGRYDGAPDSRVLWMGEHITRIKAALDKAVRRKRRVTEILR